jgi:lipopolysaccharide assembly outer membrane protein LptD (OstA)
MSGLTHATGINLVTKERWNFGGSAEFGKLRDSQTAAETNRKAAGIHMGYGREKIQFSSAVEYRRDDAEQPDLTHTIRNLLLFRNNFKLQLTPDWRMLGKLDYSISDSSLGEFFGGGYTEAVIGYAYRPVLHDRLNALVKYTYFYNVPTTDQITAQNTSAEFLQKSYIGSLDVTYDLSAKWSVGGKYANRIGEVSLDRTQPQFFDSPAHLGVLRIDWQFITGWESMAEVRMLDLPDITQTRSGALAAIYRYLGKNLKVGAGYNFTDFSDDLTDLKYNHRGVFFNFIATK